ncbi:hypothetical protein SNOG_13653 [Parastagonospora nodorum SN15]|uniref:Uncharacterized protein n=1 Tax=Phaeosphaeria nodorum (strain SN15 / ATCC MYA-4574 / FGSC 10173) TaxID=321614 RepID=Q0U3L1_PHANO|nr:hypothetical protein SNOG_13653 [Parastagonospora nodorum SN15]EAT79100.1 hypothetical protein SNOG_13653 [Parastagonospora nodorum SN15]
MSSTRLIHDGVQDSESTSHFSMNTLKSKLPFRGRPAFDSTLGGCSTSHRKYGWDQGRMMPEQGP